MSKELNIKQNIYNNLTNKEYVYKRPTDSK